MTARPPAAKAAPLAVAFALVLRGPLASGASIPLSGPFAGYDYRYGVAEGADLAGLLGRAELIRMEAQGFRDGPSGERRAWGRGEAHGLFDVPFEAAAALLDDAAAGKAYSPRLLDAALESRDGSRSVFSMDIGILFLGLHFGYRFRAEEERDVLGPREIGHRARLVESLDGSLYAMYSSWYIKEVEVGGRRLVYIRNFSSPGLRRPAPGMASLMKAFTPGELRDLVASLAAAAARRAGEAR